MRTGRMLNSNVVLHNDRVESTTLYRLDVTLSRATCCVFVSRRDADCTVRTGASFLEATALAAEATAYAQGNQENQHQDHHKDDKSHDVHPNRRRLRVL